MHPETDYDGFTVTIAAEFPVAQDVTTLSDEQLQRELDNAERDRDRANRRIATFDKAVQRESAKRIEAKRRYDRAHAEQEKRAKRAKLAKRERVTTFRTGDGSLFVVKNARVERDRLVFGPFVVPVDKGKPNDRQKWFGGDGRWALDDAFDIHPPLDS